VVREHYISKSALEIGGSYIKITGFPWQEKGTSDKVGVNSLTGKMLCKYHNNILSDIDNVGSNFLRYLNRIFEEFLNSDKIINEECKRFEGKKIELWLLKILCGLFAINHIDIPEYWIRILFGKENLSKNHGIYFFGIPGVPASWFFNLIAVRLVRNNRGEIAGAKFGLGGLPTLLAFGKPIFHEENMTELFRPSKLIFIKDGKNKEISFIGPEFEGNGSIISHVGGQVESNSRNFPRPLVSPSDND
jgi:hypothetical protein